MRKRRRELEIFSMSFLDVVSCGFGAMILLLILIKVSEPAAIERISEDLSGLVRDLNRNVFELRGRVQLVDDQTQESERKAAAAAAELAAMQTRLTKLRGQAKDKSLDSQAQSAIAEQLKKALEKLNAEQQRLLARQDSRSAVDAPIGGVPVDSEYIIFIIDTSGSMRDKAWRAVNAKVAEVLKVYPQVKGIQVMNDMGDYMFSRYAGKWIPDTPSRRRSILNRLKSWSPFSNSSPVEGIDAAIRRFASNNRKVSLYVFGDDFQKGSIEKVVQTVAALNRTRIGVGRKVRIHAMGFPVNFNGSNIPRNTVRFAALMRALAEQNGGSFVGLNSNDP